MQGKNETQSKINSDSKSVDNLDFTVDAKDITPTDFSHKGEADTVLSHDEYFQILPLANEPASAESKYNSQECDVQEKKEYDCQQAISQEDLEEISSTMEEELQESQAPLVEDEDPAPFINLESEVIELLDKLTTALQRTKEITMNHINHKLLYTKHSDYSEYKVYIECLRRFKDEKEKYQELSENNYNNLEFVNASKIKELVIYPPSANISEILQVAKETQVAFAEHISENKQIISQINANRGSRKKDKIILSEEELQQEINEEEQAKKLKEMYEKLSNQIKPFIQHHKVMQEAKLNMNQEQASLEHQLIKISHFDEISNLHMQAAESKKLFLEFENTLDNGAKYLCTLATKISKNPITAAQFKLIKDLRDELEDTMLNNFYAPSAADIMHHKMNINGKFKSLDLAIHTLDGALPYVKLSNDSNGKVAQLQQKIISRELEIAELERRIILSYYNKTVCVRDENNNFIINDPNVIEEINLSLIRTIYLKNVTGLFKITKENLGSLKIKELKIHQCSEQPNIKGSIYNLFHVRNEKTKGILSEYLTNLEQLALDRVEKNNFTLEHGHRQNRMFNSDWTITGDAKAIMNVIKEAIREKRNEISAYKAEMNTVIAEQLQLDSNRPPNRVPSHGQGRSFSGWFKGLLRSSTDTQSNRSASERHKDEQSSTVELEQSHNKVITSNSPVLELEDVFNFDSDDETFQKDNSFFFKR